MSCGKKVQFVTAHQRFMDAVGHSIDLGPRGSNMNMDGSNGTLVAEVNRFNFAGDRMQGATIIKKGDEHWVFMVKGDPNLIDRRLGGDANKRTREKAFDEDEGEGEENEGVGSDSQIVHSVETVMAGPQQDTDAAPPVVNTIVRATRTTTKRIRHSDPSGLAPLPSEIDRALDVGPSRNTRSKAVNPKVDSLRGRGGRRASTSTTARKGSGTTARGKATSAGSKGKGKATVTEERDQVAEITAGIDGFSVFSNPHVDFQPVNGLITSDPAAQQAEPQGVNAIDWANPVGHQAKVGLWLEETVHAGPQASVDAPKSKAPSSVLGYL